VGHPLLAYFPDRDWAITVPLVLILLVLFMLTTFLSLVMIKSTSQPTKKTLPPTQGGSKLKAT